MHITTPLLLPLFVQPIEIGFKHFSVSAGFNLVDDVDDGVVHFQRVGHRYESLARPHVDGCGLVIMKEITGIDAARFCE